MQPTPAEKPKDPAASTLEAVEKNVKAAPTRGQGAGSTGAKRTPRTMVRPIDSSTVPIRPRDFGYEQARHLLLRAGFGGTPKQINTVASWGPEKAVDYIVNYETVSHEAPDEGTFDRDIMRPINAEERGELATARRRGDEVAVARLRASRQEAERFDRQQMLKMQHWWLKRMIETPRPLEEKMTLFWHGHFATSYRTIEDSYHMFQQNLMFRRNAVGNFADLLFAIIRDPAMIAYLDNNDSRKGRPNENLARELMELFSLGVGNYTEQDIKEGARALTGYTFEDDEFVFNRGNHDGDPKAILGVRGKLDGDDLVKAILSNPACAKFICTKVYRYFVSHYPTGRPSLDKSAETVIRQLAHTFVSDRYDIKPVLRRLFLSEHFYQPELINEMIKSPAEIVVGSVRSLNTPVRDLGVLTDAMNLMGQNIFFPPSVKGWDGGKSWINTATLFVRQNILCFLITGKMPQGYDALANSERFDAERLLRELAIPPTADSSEHVELVAQTMLRFTVGKASRQNTDALLAYARSQKPAKNGSAGGVTPELVTGMLLLITAMPEYQLC